MATDQEILSAFLDEMILGLRQSQQEKGLRSSGESAAMLRKEEGQDEGSIIDGAGTFYYQQYGRKPGGWPPQDAILEWIKVKPIVPYGNISEESLAFLIARKIGKEGIAVPGPYNEGGVITDVINQEAIDRLKQQLGEHYVKEFGSEVIKGFSNVGNNN